MKQKCLTIFCALLLLLGASPFAWAEVNSDDALVLVGLAYGSDALDGANLSNAVGTGFRFGYLDEERNFWQMLYTSETAISIVKTQNVWYGVNSAYDPDLSLKSYSDDIVSDIAVGCWHVLIPSEAELTSFEDTSALAQSTGGFPAWIEGAWQVRLGAYTSKEEAQAMAETIGGTVVGTSSYGVSVVRTGTSTVLFQFDGGENVALAVKPGLDDTERTETNYRKRRYYGIFQFCRVRGGDLVVSNLLPLGEYINCVISREMSPSWPIEALKAQAVSARSYYEDNLGKHASYGFDICSTTDCQAYYGMANVNERTLQAVQETENLRAWYEGKPAKTFYYSSNGGGSEDVKNVWGSTYPYLCGVIDPYEATVSEKIANWKWTVTYTSAELTNLLQAKGYSCAAITDVRTETTPTGNVKSITFIDANGKSFPFVREKGVRNMLGFRSMRYTVTTSGESSGILYYIDGGGTLSSMNGVYAIGGDGTSKRLTGNPYVITGEGTYFLPGPSGGGGTAGELTFIFHGSGWGHSVGMSQWGAYAMAQQGKTFDEILKFYYPGIEIY